MTDPTANARQAQCLVADDRVPSSLVVQNRHLQDLCGKEPCDMAHLQHILASGSDGRGMGLPCFPPGEILAMRGELKAFELVVEAMAPIGIDELNGLAKAVIMGSDQKHTTQAMLVGAFSVLAVQGFDVSGVFNDEDASSTPLLFSLSCGYEKALIALLDMGADPSVRTANGRCVMDEAAAGRMGAQALAGVGRARLDKQTAHSPGQNKRALRL